MDPNSFSNKYNENSLFYEGKRISDRASNHLVTTNGYKIPFYLFFNEFSILVS